MAARKPTPEIESLRARVEALESSEHQGMLRQILDAVTQMAERVETIEQSVGDLRLAKPPPMPLGPSEVASVIRTRPMVRFQVLEDYRHAGNTLKRGREIQANHYPRLLDFVQDGLKLAVSQQRAEPPRPAAAVS